MIFKKNYNYIRNYLVQEIFNKKYKNKMKLFRKKIKKIYKHKLRRKKIKKIKYKILKIINNLTFLSNNKNKKFKINFM